MNQKQNKILSAVIVTSVAFFGFEALSGIIAANQVSLFITTAVYIFLFHVFWIAFVFDLHLKHAAAVSLTSAKYRTLIQQALFGRIRHFFQWRFMRHFLNYFILPTVLFWAAVALLFLNPFFTGLKETVILSSTFALAFAYWHMKEHAGSRMVSNPAFLSLMAAVKLYAAYIAFAAVLGFSWYFGLAPTVVFYYVFAASFFLIHQALFSYGYLRPPLVLANLASSILIGFLGIWVYHNWTFEYFAGALVLIVLYNTLWGFLHHWVEGTFTAKVALEYLVLGLLVASIVFSTHNFGSRVI